MFLPLVYVLLQRKAQTSYEAIFRVLAEYGCEPFAVNIDFEKSVQLALYSILGSRPNQILCLLSYTVNMEKDSKSWTF